MAVILRSAYDWLWCEKFWLPPNITWKDLEYDPNDEHLRNHAFYIWYSLYLSIFIGFLRFLTERFIIYPMAEVMGVKKSRRKLAPPNRLLENVYKKHGKIVDREVVLGLTKTLEMSERQIERWLRVRTKQDKETNIVKFCESGWKFFYYSCSVIFGSILLWNQSFMWNMDKEAWADYPRQIVNPGIWWYYMITLALYWSMMFSQFFDVQRKDFWEMFVHHVVTICLTSFSWICCATRVGSVIILLHDWADPFLEGAKMARYANKRKLCDTMFGIFAIVWVIARMILLPILIFGYLDRFIVGHHFEGTDPKMFQFGSLYFMNILLYILQSLHMLWTFMILKVIYKMLKGENAEDVRSDLSDSCSWESDLETKDK